MDCCCIVMHLGNSRLQISKHASNVGHHPLRQTYETNLEKFLSHPRLNRNHDLHYDLPGENGPALDIHLEQWDQPFTAQFRIQDGKLKPWATKDPAGSMQHGCTGNICSMVIDDRLYKCSRLAALPKILQERDQLDDPDWQPYLRTFVDLKQASQADIDQFYHEEGRPIPECDVCPNQRILGKTLIPRTEKTIIPLKNFTAH